MSKKLNIVSFGSLIKELGGNLTTGLSMVMWHLAYNMNKVKNLSVSLVATDFFQERSNIQGIDVIGWTKKSLVKYMIKNIFHTIKYFFLSLHLFFNYKLKIISTFIYLCFFDKVIKREQSDILHIHGTNWIYFRYIKAATRKKTILTIHGMNGFDINIRNYKNQKKIEKIITSTKFEQIVFITSDLQKNWIQQYGELASETRVILNAYNHNCFYYKEGTKNRNNKIILTTVATISPLKAQENIIKALSLLPEKDRFEYWIIGKGAIDYEKRVRKMATLSKANIFFEGQLTQSLVAEKLRQADYMILTSSSEGFGLVYIESIACGTKVIVPENLPIVKENGILNDVNSIFLKDSSIESITKCLTDLLQAEEYSIQSVAQSVSHLKWENISEEYYQLIESINNKHIIN